MISRRSLLAGLIVAPAVVRASSLMPLRAPRARVILPSEVSFEGVTTFFDTTRAGLFDNEWRYVLWLADVDTMRMCGIDSSDLMPA